MSLKTLSVAKDLAHKKADKIYVITVDENGPYAVYRDPVSVKVKVEADKLGIHVEHLFVEESQDIVHSLQVYLNEQLDVDFVVVNYA